MRTFRNITTDPDSQGKCKNCGYEDEGKEKCGRCQCSYNLRPGFIHVPYLPVTNINRSIDWSTLIGQRI